MKLQKELMLAEHKLQQWCQREKSWNPYLLPKHYIISSHIYNDDIPKTDSQLELDIWHPINAQNVLPN